MTAAHMHEAGVWVEWPCAHVHPVRLPRGRRAPLPLMVKPFRRRRRPAPVIACRLHSNPINVPQLGKVRSQPSRPTGAAGKYRRPWHSPRLCSWSGDLYRPSTPDTGQTGLRAPSQLGLRSLQRLVESHTARFHTSQRLWELSWRWLPTRTTPKCLQITMITNHSEYWILNLKIG